MKVNHLGKEIPYPLHLLSGRLQFIGLDVEDITVLISKITSTFQTTIATKDDIDKYIDDFLASYPKCAQKYKMLEEYDKKFRLSKGISPLTLVLEGSSATGKSLLSFPLIEQLGFTRIISTDSIRQILRTILSEKEHPELFCHTYQAYKCSQAGPTDLHPVVRGYLSQVELMRDTISASVQRFIREGSASLVEGVHIVPGSLSILDRSILEILIHPNEELHQNMFLMKSQLSGLKTVSSEIQIRTEEFLDTRRIQDYMHTCATNTGIPVIDFNDYESAIPEIQSLIFDHIKKLLNTSE